VPYQPFDASDQPIIVAVGNDGQFRRLATILGHPEWADDERFATNAARVAARDTLVPMIEAVIASREASVWLLELEKAGIPAGRMNSVTQAIAEPQAVHRGMRIEADGVPMVGSPVRIDGKRCDAPLAPPDLGEVRVVLERWIDADSLAALKARGVIG
jgi:formyl-CoA transferase